MTGAGYGRNLANTDPTAAEPYQRSPLSQQQPANPRTTTNARRSYIPANASTPQDSATTRNTMQPRQRNIANDNSSFNTNNNSSLGLQPPRTNDSQAGTRSGLGVVDRARPTTFDQSAFGNNTKNGNNWADSEFGAQPTQPRTRQNVARQDATPYLPATPSGSISDGSTAGRNYQPPIDSATIGAPATTGQRATNDMWANGGQAAPPSAAYSPRHQTVEQPRSGVVVGTPAMRPGHSAGPIFQSAAQPTAVTGVNGARPDPTYTPGIQRDPIRGGSFMTMLALFGSIGLNLYLGWIAWDTTTDTKIW